MAEAANLLGHQTSPYLLQHADNPVHWRPWGADALAEAAADDKPILLSIGYAACHWCHVMAHEIVRGPRHRRTDEHAVRQHQGGPRGTPRHRPSVYVRAARPGRAGRLAAHHVPRPRWRAVLGRHVFSALAALGAAVVPPGAARHCRRLARARHHGDAEHRGAAADAGAAIRRAWRRPADAHAPRRGQRRAAAHHRPGAGRHQGRAEIPQPADLSLPVAERVPHRGSGRAGRGASAAATHVARRHLRPSRRRLCPLCHRRNLAGAAFREDAVRQRADPRAAGVCARAPPGQRCMPRARPRRSAG